MRVLIIGGSGFIASKLCKRIVDGAVSSEDGGKIKIGAAATGECDESDSSSYFNCTEIKELIVADISEHPSDTVALLLTQAKDKDSKTFPITYIPGFDITKGVESVQQVIQKYSPSVIFHTAAIVSGDAEQNFELGYSVNVDGTRNILDAIRRNLETCYNKNNPPRVVFTSSIAVFGVPMPEMIHDDFHTTPRTSYGVQKLICEQLMEDYTRKGYIDGVSIRLPTIAIRPGKPNKAASSFFSGIIREPLNGQDAILPVNMDVRHPIASPRSAVQFLLRAAALDRTKLQPGDRTITCPSVSITIQEMIASLERVTGSKDITKLIQHQPDTFTMSIVNNWPKGFIADKAIRLGFQVDKSFDDIIRGYIEDENLIASPRFTLLPPLPPQT